MNISIYQAFLLNTVKATWPCQCVPFPSPEYQKAFIAGDNSGQTRSNARDRLVDGKLGELQHGGFTPKRKAADDGKLCDTVNERPGVKRSLQRVPGRQLACVLTILYVGY